MIRVITIEREYGSGGADIARKLAERLGWHRGDDVASALIPQFYFDYLRGGTGNPLAGVVKHNQMDLRGLAALFGKINSLLDTRGSLDDEKSLDLFGLSRFLERRGERDRAHTTCVKAMDAGLPAEFRPLMGYASETLPGVWRGPHEHHAQADCFCFLGPSTFEIRLWDNRPASPTFWHHETALVGANNPMLVIVPPGVVHAYRNVGSAPGLIINCPDRLYRGAGKQELVDEIRHENDPATPFRIDDAI